MGSINIPPTGALPNSLITPQDSTANSDTDLATSVGNTLKATFDRSGAAKAKVDLSIEKRY